jgi:hypothetical protein
VLLWRAVEKKLQNKFGGLEIKFYLCTRFESRAANFRGRGFFRTGCTRHKKKIKNPGKFAGNKKQRIFAVRLLK